MMMYIHRTRNPAYRAMNLEIFGSFCKDLFPGGHRESLSDIVGDVYTSNKAGSTPCACTTVKKLSRVLGRTYDEALSGTQINITQLAVMRCIHRRAGEPLARVAHELEMDRTSLYRALNPMIRDGWLVLAAGSTPRSRSATITRKGMQVLAAAGKGWDGIQERLIGNFGPKAYQALMSELSRLADCAEAASR
jgi:DNA-binding MarR family transcriptional regulator